MSQPRKANDRGRGTAGIVSGEDHDEPHLLDISSLDNKTQTIDLNSLFTANITESGSFDIRGVRKTTFARLLDALPIPALLVAKDNSIAFSNEAFEKTCEDSENLWLAPFPKTLFRPADQQRCEGLLETVRRDRQPQVMEAIVGQNDRRIWGRVHMRSVRMGEDRYILILVEDLTAEKKQAALSRKYTSALKKAHDELEERVTERTAELLKINEELRREIVVRKRAQKTLNLAAKVISTCNEAILITDSHANIVHVNEAFCRITGYTREEVVGKNPRILASGRHGADFWQEFWKTLRETGQWRGEVWDRRRNGDVFPKILAVSAIKSENQVVTHYVGIASDITKMKETEERLEVLAHYDPLTQLPNRLLFRDRVMQSLLNADRHGHMLALMFVDLDGFKNVNDTLGHPKGDELLVAVAKRLRECVRRSDTVARLGGDEFTVLMPDLTEMRHAIPVANKIISALSTPFVFKDKPVFTSASIGISVFPTNAQDFDSLLKQADTAMYCAKSRGKNRFQFFSDQMNHELTRLAGMELTLRRAMESGGLALYYQPVYDARSGSVVGMEGLLRLRDDTGRIVSIGPYIPVAEERGMILPIGEWVLRAACRQAGIWHDAGHKHLRVAVNVSMRQLRERNLFSRFMSVIEESGYDPKHLELELTESSIMENPTLTIETLEKFRRQGVSITIDDFGTGYSSLSRLRTLPVDKLKVDSGFVSEISSDPSHKALVHAIITVAHSLNMQVVAEGVETREQLDILKELNCDALQGYYFYPAIPAKRFEEVILRGTPDGPEGGRTASMAESQKARLRLLKNPTKIRHT